MNFSQTCVGSSENVNYAVHSLCGLLVELGIFEHVYTNRFPPGFEISCQLRYEIFNRHSHFNLDAKNQNYTVRFAGTRTTAGLEGGVPTLSVFDQEMKNSFVTGGFTLKRKVALLHFSKFFEGWLAFSGYGVQRGGRYATNQGGRDLEAMHIHYYYDNAKKGAFVQYKYHERAELSYLPLSGGIQV